MNCKCYIGIINDYDNTRMTTLDGLKIHIKEKKFDKLGYFYINSISLAVIPQFAFRLTSYRKKLSQHRS